VKNWIYICSIIYFDISRHWFAENPISSRLVRASIFACGRRFSYTVLFLEICNLLRKLWQAITNARINGYVPDCMELSHSLLPEKKRSVERKTVTEEAPKLLPVGVRKSYIFYSRTICVHCLCLFSADPIFKR